MGKLEMLHANVWNFRNVNKVVRCQFWDEGVRFDILVSGSCI